MIVTISRNPVEELFAHVFGAAHALNLLTGDGSRAELRSAATPPGGWQPARLATLADVGQSLLQRAGDGLVLRIVDPAALADIEAACPALVRDCRMIWLETGHAADRAKCRIALDAYGFRHSMAVAPHPGAMLSRTALQAEPLPDYFPRQQLRKLVLLDNNLTGERGHYLSVARRISEGAHDAGVAVVWGTHARFPPGAAPEGVQVEPVFPRSIFDVPLGEHEAADFSDEILAGWRQLAAAHPEPTTHFLVPTLDGHFVRAVHRLMREDLGIPGVIHLSTPYETRHMPARIAGREVDWHLRELSRLACFGSRLFLWTETEALASIYRSRVSSTVRALPLPAAGDHGSATFETASGPVVFTFLGEARIDKGFQNLPRLTQAMLAGRPTGALEIRIYYSAPFGGFTPELAAARAQLEACDAVVLGEGVLSEDDYRLAIHDADAILLPYDPDYYKARGSGILTEALSFGRLVIGSAGTVIEEYRTDSVFPCRTTEDWIAAADAVISDAARMRAGSAARSTQFRARYAARAYIDRLAFRVA